MLRGLARWSGWSLCALWLVWAISTAYLVTTNNARARDASRQFERSTDLKPENTIPPARTADQDSFDALLYTALQAAKQDSTSRTTILARITSEAYQDTIRRAYRVPVRISSAQRDSLHDAMGSLFATAFGPAVKWTLDSRVYPLLGFLVGGPLALLALTGSWAFARRRYGELSRDVTI
ncbi:MAG: hypothetical protein ABJD11_03515 [Gemmatimonadota bacterium]